MSDIGARLGALVVRRPRAVLLVALACALAVVPLSIRLRLDTDLVDLLPRRAPEAATFARFTRLFASEQPFIVLVECDDPGRLTDFADRYAAALAARPDVSEVRSRLGAGAARAFRDHILDLLDDAEQDALAARASPKDLDAQVRRIRSLLAAPGGSAMAPLLTADPLELIRLVGPRLSAGLPVDAQSGYYKSADGKALLLLVQPKAAPFDIEADRRLIEGAAGAARALGARAGIDAPMGDTPRVDFTGPYAYTLAYRDWLHRDMQISTVVTAASVLLFFAVLLGAVRALPIVAVPLHVGLWFTAAVAAALYGRVNAVSLAFGTILLSIGIDLPIQIYQRLREELGRAAPLDALERTIAALAGPALLATLGPTVVFFACSLSEYKGLGELGVLAGAGLLLNLAVMLTVLPALLAVVPARLWMPRRALGTPPRTSWFAALGRAAARRPRIVLGAAALLALALAPAAGKLQFDRRLLSIEPPDMAPAKVRRALEQRFGVRDRLLIVLHEADGDDLEPALQQADRWRARADQLRKEGLLVGYESLASIFPSRAEVARRRARLDEVLAAKPEQIPAAKPEQVPAAKPEQVPAAKPEQVPAAKPGVEPAAIAVSGRARLARDLRAALESAGADLEPFGSFLSQLDAAPPPLVPEAAGPDLSFLVRAHVKRADHKTYLTTFLYPASGHLEEALSAATRLAAAHPEDGRLTGTPVLEDALYRVVKSDTLRVTVASVLAVALLIALYYRRARPAIAVLLPLTLAWLLFAAVLGAVDLPLNLFNLLTVPLVVGYGIDDHVFLVHRHAEDPDAGPAPALASTGRAIVVTSLSTMAGFAGLAAARFDGLRQLGIAGTLAVALCLVAALLVLPALLAALYPPRDR